MASSVSFSIFQRARQELEGEIDQFIHCLNQRKFELFAEIESLESEYKNKQKQKQIDINKLTVLKSQTEELGQNSLVAVQHRVLGEIQKEIDRLRVLCNVQPDYEIKFEWDECREFFRENIKDSIKLNLIHFIKDSDYQDDEQADTQPFEWDNQHPLDWDNETTEYYSDGDPHDINDNDPTGYTDEYPDDNWEYDPGYTDDPIPDIWDEPPEFTDETVPDDWDNGPGWDC